jgi:dephospho-CoA kinase
MMHKIALTGGIASGKSTALQQFSDKGYYTINLDEVSNNLHHFNDEYRQALLDEFGTLEKAELRRTVFKNPKEVEKLNKITHPIILRELNRIIAKVGPDETINNIVVVEVPLLFEAHLEDKFDKVISVITSLEIRIERLKSKGLTKEEADKVIAAQVSDEFRKKHSDITLDGTKIAKLN